VSPEKARALAERETITGRQKSMVLEQRQGRQWFSGAEL
jgi:hypothetical protein